MFPDIVFLPIPSLTSRLPNGHPCRGRRGGIARHQRANESRPLLSPESIQRQQRADHMCTYHPLSEDGKSSLPLRSIPQAGFQTVFQADSQCHLQCHLQCHMYPYRFSYWFSYWFSPRFLPLSATRRPRGNLKLWGPFEILRRLGWNGGVRGAPALPFGHAGRVTLPERRRRVEDNAPYQCFEVRGCTRRRRRRP